MILVLICSFFSFFNLNKNTELRLYAYNLKNIHSLIDSVESKYILVNDTIKRVPYYGDGTDGRYLYFRNDNVTGYTNAYNKNKYEVEEEEANSLERIKKYFYKYNFLQKIKSNNTNINVKILLIEKYDKEINGNNYLLNLTAGGLYNDWNFDINL